MLSRESCAGAFSKLDTLWLGHNRVCDWQSVDALSALPALRELRLSGNPVLDGPEGEARFEVRIPRTPRAMLLICLLQIFRLTSFPARLLPWPHNAPQYTGWMLPDLLSGRSRAVYMR